MLQLLMSTGLFAALSLASPQGSAGDLGYRWLTGSELESLLRGSRIVEDNNHPAIMKTPEEFRQDGWYVRFADNYEANGKYSFRDDAVCDHALGEREICRKVLIDKHGQYWIMSRDVPRFVVRVSVKPIR